MPAAPLMLCLAALLAALPLRAAAIDRLHRSGFEDSFCQDGVEQEAEQCDDGDADDADGCTSQCRLGVPCDAAAFPGGDRFLVDPASGHCYVAHENEASTIDEANTACLLQGSHLVSITSAAEDTLLRPLQQPGQRPWIGLTDLANEGEFAWLSGEPFVYQRFILGQPDSDGHCVHLGDAAGGWADTECNVTSLVNARWCEREP